MPRANRTSSTAADRPASCTSIDEQTLAFVDFKGNRQFITQGNLSDNPHAFIFLIDFATRRRIKLWGTARIVEDDAELLRKLMPAGYKARAEQIVLFTVTAWDENCPQHIPQRFEAADVVRELEERDRRIAELEAELGAARLSAARIGRSRRCLRRCAAACRWLADRGAGRAAPSTRRAR